MMSLCVEVFDANFVKVNEAVDSSVSVWDGEVVRESVFSTVGTAVKLFVGEKLGVGGGVLVAEAVKIFVRVVVSASVLLVDTVWEELEVSVKDLKTLFEKVVSTVLGKEKVLVLVGRSSVRVMDRLWETDTVRDFV